MFEDGPLADGRLGQVHSLIVHMQGDGRHSIGSYRQAWYEGVPLGKFEWHPENEE